MCVYVCLYLSLSLSVCVSLSVCMLSHSACTDCHVISVYILSHLFGPAHIVMGLMCVGCLVVALMSVWVAMWWHWYLYVEVSMFKFVSSQFANSLRLLCIYFCLLFEMAQNELKWSCNNSVNQSATIQHEQGQPGRAQSQVTDWTLQLESLHQPITTNVET